MQINFPNFQRVLIYSFLIAVRTCQYFGTNFAVEIRFSPQSALTFRNLGLDCHVVDKTPKKGHHFAWIGRAVESMPLKHYNFNVITIISK